MTRASERQSSSLPLMRIIREKERESQAVLTLHYVPSLENS